jgi:hypothetical protein
MCRLGASIKRRHTRCIRQLPQEGRLALAEGMGTMQMFGQKALTLLASAALLATSASCSRNRGMAPPSPDSSTVIEVDNQAVSDIVVYIANGGARFRLGLVTSQSQQRFSLPRQFHHANGAVQFVARPIAGRAYALPSVLVSTGQRILVTLLSQPSLSNVAVWDH